MELAMQASDQMTRNQSDHWETGMSRDSFCRVILEGIGKEETGYILTVCCLVLWLLNMASHPPGPRGPPGRNDASLSVKEIEGRCVRLTTEMWKVRD